MQTLENNCEVRFPKGRPVPCFPELKLRIMFLNKLTIFLSGILSSNILINTSWSILAKNFLISHFKTQQVLVLFLEIIRPNSLNLLIALWVPLLILQEKESVINVVSKKG